MPRVASVTKERLIAAAVELLEKEGIEEVTARKVAKYAGCSTQPIFKSYKGMNELIADVVNSSADAFKEYYDSYNANSNVPFVNLGMAYISFAKNHEHMFRLLFASHIEKTVSTYELINGGDKGYVLSEINKCQDRAKGGEIFSDIWMYIHGCACLVLNGEFDLTDEETVQAISGIYNKLAR